MRVRLSILVIGILLGLVFKWGLGGLADARFISSPTRNEEMVALEGKSDATPLIDGLKDSYVDPLVPPADVLVESHQTINALTRGTGPVIPSVLPLLTGDFFSDERAFFEPHGEQVCASGCAVSRHPTKELTKTAFRQLLEQFEREPISEESHALETLLFFGRQTKELIMSDGIGPLDSQRAAALQHELSRTHALISIRVVDENGVVRSSLPPTSVPLDRRHVFSMNVNEVQPLVTSGTVKRVGLYHLWTRL